MPGVKILWTLPAGPVHNVAPGIIVIALGTVKGAAMATQVALVSGIALRMTVGVYALVAGIVKMDDAGLHLVKTGTAAMFLVGGGILMHGWPGSHALRHGSAEAVTAYRRSAASWRHWPPRWAHSCRRATISTLRQENTMSPRQQPSYNLKPHVLFLATLLAVFVSELAVMFALDLLPELPTAGEAFLDACLLSLLVVPCLYFLFLRPFQRNIEIRQQAEIEHQKIQALNRMKSEFISIAAHELRTPLTTIMGYSELLLDGSRFDQTQRDDFAIIINQKADTMDRLVDDLLDMGRIELGQPLRVNKARHDMVDTIVALVDEYRKKHPQREFRVTLPAPPVAFDFDKVRIEQVLDNLLNNAVKFSPGIAPVDVEGAVCEENFRITVRDRGIGMTPEEQEHVFDKFYRADNSNTSPSGLGLGMAIAKEIIVSHGGGIWVESRPKQGTTAYVSLPITMSS